VNKIELKSLLAERAQDTPTGRVVRTLSERGTLSATQIVQLTGLAKSTVSTVLAELRRTDMVVEVGSDAGRGVGRPATALTLNPRAGSCIGILTGQTEIQVILADVSHSVLYDRTVTALGPGRNVAIANATLIAKVKRLRDGKEDPVDVRLRATYVLERVGDTWKARFAMVSTPITTGALVGRSVGVVARLEPHGRVQTSCPATR
jgi:hypothetical protein